MNIDDKLFLLEAYGQMYNSECGPWNLSLTSKWLEYEITKFFEDNFKLDNFVTISNIGIGSGFWDRYLSYKMPQNCLLVSIDKDYECCKQLKLSLINEGNPNKLEIINDDVISLNSKYEFDLITMIGSTVGESGLYKTIIIKAMSMLRSGGCLFYSSLNFNETKDDLNKAIDQNKYFIKNYEVLENYSRKLILSKITKK